MASHHIRGTNAIRQQRTFRPLPPLLHSTHHGRWPPKRADGALDGPPDDRENAYAAVAPDQIFDVSYSPSQLLPLEALRRPVESTQYLSIRYTERLTEAGIEPSVGSRGDSYDNALAESVIGLFKTEIIRRQGPWRSIEDVEFATLEWVWWFNTHRLLEPIGHVPPAEYEEAYYLRLHTPAELGTLNTNGLR